MSKRRVSKTDNSVPDIDYNVILDFLETYGGRKKVYSKKNAEPSKKLIVSSASNARKNMKIICNVMAKNERDNFILSDKISRWLKRNGVDTWDYLWGQLKKQEYKNLPISISIFANKSDLFNEITNETTGENDKISGFRVALELEDDKNKNIHENNLIKYHRYLGKDVPKDGLWFVRVIKGNGNDVLEKITDMTQEQIREKIESSEITDKVQICYVIPKKDDVSSEEIKRYYYDEICKGIELIKDHYDYVVEKFDSTENEVSDESQPVLKPEPSPTPDDIKEQVNYPLNQILYGPPGTGKTYNAVRYAVAICEKKSINDDYLKDYPKVIERYNQYKTDKRIAFTTFHQSYGYEEFIEGIKPVSSKNGKITYEVKPGVFKAFCDEARKHLDENYVFIIDEINRGNISKIFGELITLIEDSKREGAEEAMAAILPYSSTASSDSNAEFSVPKNVYILGTMNTADRSIALLDTALRRRFNFVEMMPDMSVLGGIKVKVGDIDICKMLEKMNARIEALYDREHTIGHALFMGLQNDRTIDKLAEIFQNKIIPLLQEYFYEDYKKIQLVLGDNAKGSDDNKFIVEKENKASELFSGSPSEIKSIAKNKYAINPNAFTNADSYKKIYSVNSDSENKPAASGNAPEESNN